MSDAQVPSDELSIPVWILSRVRLPAYGVRVFVSCEYEKQPRGYVQIGTRDHTNKSGEHWLTDDSRPLNAHVYAWMPLPGALNER
jgi:hypothetical protein